MVARSSRISARPFGAAAIVAGITAVTPAALAEPTPADRALATELFDKGRALIAAGKPEEACPMLAESQRLDPGAGTLLNLANCHELEGKLATAWTEFNDALAEAERKGQADRVAFAKKHIASIAPELPRLTIVVPEAVDRPDLEITRDGSAVARVAWGLDVPIDPGSHEIAVTAPGLATWTRTVEVERGERRELVVEPLGPAVESKPEPPPIESPHPIAPAPLAPAPPGPLAPAAPLPPRPAAPLPPRAIAGITVGSIGLAGLTAGVVAGALAISKNARSEELCMPRCNDEGYSLNQQAKTAADVSTVSFVVGAVATGVGVVLIVTSAPRKAPATARR